MARNSGSNGQYLTSKQKGKKHRGSGKLSNYARMNKHAKRDVYDRPYLDGNYRKELEF